LAIEDDDGGGDDDEDDEDDDDEEEEEEEDEDLALEEEEDGTGCANFVSASPSTFAPDNDDDASPFISPSPSAPDDEDRGTRDNNNPNSTQPRTVS